MPFGFAHAEQRSGIRLGTPELTTRGLIEPHVDLVGAWIDEAGSAAVKVTRRVFPRTPNTASLTTPHPNNPVRVQIAWNKTARNWSRAPRPEGGVGHAYVRLPSCNDLVKKAHDSDRDADTDDWTRDVANYAARGDRNRENCQPAKR